MKWITNKPAPYILTLTMVSLVVISISLSAGAEARSLQDDIDRPGPYFDVNIKSDPRRVWPVGTGKEPMESSINLSFEASGQKALKFDPQDTALIVDCSQSMEWNDPNYLRVDATRKYVDNMVQPDRGAAVKMATNGTLKHSLTDNYQSLKDSLAMSTQPGGSTNFEEAVSVATEELVQNGDPDKQRLEILLTDGEPTTNVTRDTMEDVWSNNITMYTIGLGQDLDEALLTWMANTTRGEYFHVNNADQLVSAYLSISDQYYTDKAGENITVRMDFEDHVHVDTASFTKTPSNTSLGSESFSARWELNETMVLDDSWDIRFDVKISRKGKAPLFQESSGIYYTKPWDGESNFTAFPSYSLYGIIQTSAPPPPPPPPPTAAPPPPPVEIFPMPSPPMGTLTTIPQATVQPVAQATGYQALFAPFIGLGMGEALKGTMEVSEKEGIQMQAGKKPDEEEEEKEERSLGYTWNER